MQVHNFNYQGKSEIYSVLLINPDKNMFYLNHGVIL